MTIRKFWIFSLGKNGQYWAGLRVGSIDFLVRPLVTPTDYDRHNRLADTGHPRAVRYPPSWKRPRIGTYDFRIEHVYTSGEDEGMGTCRFGLNLILGRYN